MSELHKFIFEGLPVRGMRGVKKGASRATPRNASTSASCAGLSSQPG